MINIYVYISVTKVPWMLEPRQLLLLMSLRASRLPGTQEQNWNVESRNRKIRVCIHRFWNNANSNTQESSLTKQKCLNVLCSALCAQRQPGTQKQNRKVASRREKAKFARNRIHKKCRKVDFARNRIDDKSNKVDFARNRIRDKSRTVDFARNRIDDNNRNMDFHKKSHPRYKSQSRVSQEIASKTKVEKSSFQEIASTKKVEQWISQEIASTAQVEKWISQEIASTTKNRKVEFARNRFDRKTPLRMFECNFNPTC